VHVARTAAERTGQRRRQLPSKIAPDRDCERQEKERREGEPSEIGLSKPDEPACQRS
jgi:hypothetical protein